VAAAIVPIFKGDEEKAKVAAFIKQILTGLVGAEELSAGRVRTSGDGIESYFFDRSADQHIVVDWRDARPGDKQYHWEQRGVPFRLEVGPRDVDGETFVLKRRLDRAKEVVQVGMATHAWLRGKLEEVHRAMLDKARIFRDQMTQTAGSYEQMKKIIAEKGGF